MKKLICSLLLAFCLLPFLPAAVMTTAPVTPHREVIDFDTAFDQLQKSVDQQFSLSQFESAVGRRAKFRERIALKVWQKSAQRKLRKLQRKLDRFNSTDCDLLVLPDGTQREVQIIAMTSGEIEYRECGRSDGPTYHQNQAEVFAIKHRDGTKAILNAAANPIANDGSTPVSVTEQVKTSGAVAVGILGGFFLGLIGMLFCFIYPKGIMRQAFWKGWLIGFLILLALLLITQSP
ncbi:MAG: hypothetical protein AAFW73_05930 [Bacteroidota bacterium]